jgi:hypothetical protein
MKHSVSKLAALAKKVLLLSALVSSTVPARPLAAPGGCSHESERLVKSIVAYSSRTTLRGRRTLLNEGRYIYRCGQKGSWTEIMYPQVGERVDCSVRRPGFRCHKGWALGELKTEAYD